MKNRRISQWNLATNDVGLTNILNIIFVYLCSQPSSVGEHFASQHFCPRHLCVIPEVEQVLTSFKYFFYTLLKNYIYNSLLCCANLPIFGCKIASSRCFQINMPLKAHSLLKYSSKVQVAHIRT